MVDSPESSPGVSNSSASNLGQVLHWKAKENGGLEVFLEAVETPS